MARMPVLLTIPVVTAAVALVATPVSATETVPPAATEATLTPQDQQAEGAQSREAVRAERASRARASLVRVALTRKGDSYVAGASGPTAFDCSGFTMWVYKKALGKSLPHYSGAQMDVARRVSVKNLKPGDLLFYGRGGSQHVSMYIGKGKMIHATNPREGVVVQSIHVPWFWNIMAGAGRVIRD